MNKRIGIIRYFRFACLCVLMSVVVGFMFNFSDLWFYVLFYFIGVCVCVFMNGVIYQ